MGEHRETTRVRGVFCGSLLRVAERNQREQQRIAAGILPQREKSRPGRTKTLERGLALINARPRKVLHFKSAADLRNKKLENY